MQRTKTEDEQGRGVLSPAQETLSDVIMLSPRAQVSTCNPNRVGPGLQATSDERSWWNYLKGCRRKPAHCWRVFLEWTEDVIRFETDTLAPSRLISKGFVAVCEGTYSSVCQDEVTWFTLKESPSLTNSSGWGCLSACDRHWRYGFRQGYSERKRMQTIIRLTGLPSNSCLQWVLCNRFCESSSCLSFAKTVFCTMASTQSSDS